MTEIELAKQIVDAADRIHTTLGPGLLETVYGLTLAWELEKRGLHLVRQPEVPIVYQGTRIEVSFRADLIVEDKVIVEVKSVEALAGVPKKQLLTYLRLADKRLGLLINFNVSLSQDGIPRIVNGLAEPRSRKGAEHAKIGPSHPAAFREDCLPVWFRLRRVRIVALLISRHWPPVAQ